MLLNNAFCLNLNDNIQVLKFWFVITYQSLEHFLTPFRDTHPLHSLIKCPCLQQCADLAPALKPLHSQPCPCLSCGNGQLPKTCPALEFILLQCTLHSMATLISKTLHLITIWTLDSRVKPTLAPSFFTVSNTSLTSGLCALVKHPTSSTHSSRWPQSYSLFPALHLETLHISHYKVLPSPQLCWDLPTRPDLS